MKQNRKLTEIILILLFVTSILSLVSKVPSDGLIYGIIGFILLYDKNNIKIYDYIFTVSLALGIIVKFVNILLIMYILLMCILSICLYCHCTYFTRKHMAVKQRNKNNYCFSRKGIGHNTYLRMPIYGHERFISPIGIMYQPAMAVER